MVSKFPLLPGMVREPSAFIIASLAAILEPMVIITEAEGPIKMIPALLQSSANSALSDKNHIRDELLHNLPSWHTQ